jgi:hypothetical protein
MSDWKLTARFGSKYKKGYTYKAEKIFDTRKQAADEQRKMKSKHRDPHVKQKFRITKVRPTKRSSGMRW